MALSQINNGDTGLSVRTTLNSLIALAGTNYPFTSGSVIFADSGGFLNQDNTNLLWDDTNNILKLAGGGTQITGFAANPVSTDPTAVYVGSSASVGSFQAGFAFAQNSKIVTIVYEDGTQYWDLRNDATGAFVGEIGYTTPGGIPGVGIFGSSFSGTEGSAGRSTWIFDVSSGNTHWGTKTGSGAANNMMTLRSSDICSLQSGGIFAWTSSATDSNGTLDTGAARNAAGVVEINNGTAATYRDLKLRSLLPIAGTASVAPITLTSGTNLTTAAAGAHEYDGTAHYLTSVASARQVAVTEQIIVNSSGRTFTNNTSAQAIFTATANGAVTLAASTTYEFEMFVAASGFSSSAHTLNLTFATSGSFTGIGYYFNAQTSSTFATPTTALSGWISVGTASAVCASTTTTGLILYVRGTIRMGTGGTVTPQLTQVTNSAAATCQNNCFFRCWPIGSDTVTNVGNWS